MPHSKPEGCYSKRQNALIRTFGMISGLILNINITLEETFSGLEYGISIIETDLELRQQREVKLIPTRDRIEWGGDQGCGH